MTIVVDTNVLLSMAFTTRGKLGSLRRLWREKKFTIAISEPILAEVERALSYPNVQSKHGWSAAQKKVYLSNLRHHATVYPGTTPVALNIRDTGDAQFLVCAVEAKATIVVSGDGDLLAVGHYKRIRILSPADYLKRYFPHAHETA